MPEIIGAGTRYESPREQNHAERTVVGQRNPIEIGIKKNQIVFVDGDTTDTCLEDKGIDDLDAIQVHRVKPGMISHDRRQRAGARCGLRYQVARVTGFGPGAGASGTYQRKNDDQQRSKQKKTSTGRHDNPPMMCAVRGETGCVGTNDSKVKQATTMLDAGCCCNLFFHKGL